MNYVAGDDVTVDPLVDIEFGAWDWDLPSEIAWDASADYANGVRVQVRRNNDSPDGPISMFLMPMFDQDLASVGSSGAAVGALLPREVMIAQDVTGSFADEMPEARDAVLTFLEYMGDNNFPGDSIGMATFVGGAEVWTPLSEVVDEYTTIYDQWDAYLTWCDRSYSPWDRIYRGYYYHSAPNMTRCNYPYEPAAYPSDTGTNQGDGLFQAITELTEEGSDRAVKSIVLVSDGKPECPLRNRYQKAACESWRRSYGLSMADWADEEEISIYSVSFNNSTGSAYAEQSAYMESLVRGNGSFYETPDPEELPDILLEIAQSIPIALVK